MAVQRKYVVYVLECADGTLYTGITTDLPRRLEEHRRGVGAKYTRGRGPFTLRLAEPEMTRSDALRREWEIKRMNRKAKNRLIAEKGVDREAAKKL
ncbi:hypothetical protein CHM34_16905 [Paludifilum halophilum]|uniref:GIY-YIG domain-containing protein n=2 Tax=Paludifilum halophilum TaxID=1642702 RepID=A0A235B287_9BACL|nr:GIY-YIG nuclease family protein [Paludifilum halophilum]OYD06403.1 hypothetical protein CHM34_16905 [Paludifilum halophilum]